MHPRMGSYRLSLQARSQIRDIGRFSKRRFGAYQAQAYHACLLQTFPKWAPQPTSC